QDLFVVGDPRQAVYAWNGADPTLLDRIETILPGTTVVRLDDNHRSTPQVLQAARGVLGDHDATGTTATPETPDGPAPLVGVYDDEEAEAAAAVRWLRLAHGPGRAWSHMAVLARTARRLDAVAAALERAGIPHRRAGAPAVAGSPDVLRALRRVGPGAPLRSALTDAAEAAGGRTLPSALGRLADEYALEDPEPTAGAFLSWLAATVGTVEDDPPADGGDGEGDAWPRRGGEVVLSTFHRAKGLEWPVVAIVGLEDGTCPIAYASGAEAIAEERRLLYVAVTRAEVELWCSWAARRTIGGTERECTRSPFLDAVATMQPAVPTRAEVSARVAELRSRLSATG
ncbi:MAG TPA: ATP-dependent helicase, partial [Acidimicrobiales bacterium]|nr:ATP-dependent helicase [Acidimicrobiales bacterium]